jgi:S-methylmethionine-dependent homocysteine/selenocysteine methylase
MYIVVPQIIVNKQCSSFGLKHNEITSAGASIHADTLHNHASGTLFLGINCLSNGSIKSIVKTPSVYKSTREWLRLEENGLKDSGAKYLT